MGADNPEDEEEKSTKISKDMAGNMFDQIMNDQGGIWEKERKRAETLSLNVITDLGLTVTGTEI